MCVCVCVCMQVLDCVFGNSDENVQTAYKVCKFMYCAVVQMCVKNTFDSIHVHFNHLGSFLPRKCVHELHKISCNSYYILITQQRLVGASISSKVAPIIGSAIGIGSL